MYLLFCMSEALSVDTKDQSYLRYMPLLFQRRSQQIWTLYYADSVGRLYAKRSRVPTKCRNRRADL